MITHLRGRLIEKNTTSVVLECQGVGYEVHISLYTFEQIPDEAEILLYTHHVVREDAHLLYGFLTKKERELFRLMISVSGIGTNTARSILSFISPDQFIEAVISENAAALQSIKGIGEKTAQRTILELRDKITKLEMSTPAGRSVSVKGISAKYEAGSALEVLGYPRKQTEKALDAILRENPDAGVEQLVRQALRSL